jgi:LCP family protein required for cell wall assembly
MAGRRRYGVGAGAGGGPRRRRSWKQRILLTVGSAVVAVSLGGASVAGYVLIKYNSIERYEDLDTDAAPAGDPENYLLVGSDSRAEASADEAAEIGGQRSDTIMIVRIDPAEEQASVLSLQRDLWVPIAGTGEEDKINSAYALGTPDEGRQRLIDTIRENFGIPIHHYVEIDFQGFGRLVDTVGGVPLFFRQAVRDQSSGFYEDRLDCVTLDGERALQFVRSRYLDYMTPEGEWRRDPTADHGRITRQQIFIREAVSQTVDEIRSNPLKVNQLIDIGTDSVGLDEGIGIGDIRDLADRFSDFSEESLHTYALPVTEDRVGGADILRLVEGEAEAILNVFRGLDPGEISPGLVSVAVLNGNGQQGQANNVAGALQAVGFDMVGIGNVPEGLLLPRTQVHHGPGDEAAGLRVARHITGGAELVPDESLEAGSVEVWTGADFTTIHEQPTPIDQMTTTTTAGGGGGDDGSTTTSAPATTTTTASTTTTAPPPTTEPPGHAVGEVPPGANCS